MLIFNSILAIIIGYILGTILMAFILGKLFRRIDIREHGSRNAGTMNAFHVLGKSYGITTMLFDMCKGVLAVYIAQLLRVPTPVVLASGFAAVIGHTFPFYLKFRGGRGAASAYGLLIWLFVIFGTNYLRLQSIIPFSFFLYFAIVTYWVTRSANLLAFVFMPTFVVLIFWQAGFNAYTIFATILCAYLIGASAYTVNKYGGLKAELERQGRKVVKIKLIRKTVRLGSILIPLLYLVYTLKLAGGFTAVMLGLFIIFEIIRRVKPDLHKNRALKIILKKHEPGKLLSGYTYYLISVLFVMLVFPKGIAVASLLFLTWGDVAAELTGLNFPRLKTFPKKTLEGSLGCFSVCLLLGFFVMIFHELTLLQIIIGSLAATIVESIPKIEDNLFMGPAAALFMWILR